MTTGPKANAFDGYHAGELATQARAGETERAAHLGRSIRATVPPVAAQFLAQRQLLVLAAADGAGRMWATMLTGEPGFLGSPDEHTVTVSARPGSDNPLAAVLEAPTQVGTIAIEPATRRRMRVNGQSEPTRDGLVISAEQVFSNCPKYIQRRTPEPIDVKGTGGTGSGRVAASVLELTLQQQSLIRAADTFFLASADDKGHPDASHRGGNPGFVEVLSPTRLRWPEYQGNAAYMTLGNLELAPAAGLLFPDWASGTLLLLTGTARTEWVGGARPWVDFTLTEALEFPGALPFRWTEPEYSPANPPVTRLDVSMP